MKSLTRAVLAGSLLWVSGFAAAAEDTTPSPIAGNVALTSNYVFRGISQSAKRAAIQGGFDYAHSSGFYVGTWGSSINFGEGTVTPGDDRASLEWDLYTGYKFKAGLDWDVGLIHYGYPTAANGAPNGGNLNMYEVYFGGTWKFLTAKLSYTGDYTGFSDKPALYADVAGNFEVGAGFTLNTHVGYNTGRGIDETWGRRFWDYKIGVTKDWGKGLSTSLAWTATTLRSSTANFYNSENTFNPQGQVSLTLMKSL